MSSDAVRPGGKRERTRAALMQAAIEVAEEKGFLAASLEEIAVRAGMTKGAIYSNFGGKADLMAAALGRKTLRLEPEYVPGAPLTTQLQAAARALVALLPAAQSQQKLNAQHQIYAITDPDFAARVEAVYVAELDRVAQMVAQAYGDRLAMTPRQFAVSVQVLCIGFLHQHRITPDEITEEVVLAAFQAMAVGSLKP